MFKTLFMNGKTTPLYYHKTGGGAEYLFDTFVECPNGDKEGIIADDTSIMLRVDGQELEIIRLVR